MKKIGLMDVKEALKDSRFRDSLPRTYQDDIVRYMQCGSCPGNIPFYRKIVKECREQLGKYFPGREITDEEEEIKKLATNNWVVISSHMDELQERLHRLPPGRKQVAIARYEDMVTAVINELDVLY